MQTKSRLRKLPSCGNEYRQFDIMMNNDKGNWSGQYDYLRSYPKKILKCWTGWTSKKSQFLSGCPYLVYGTKRWRRKSDSRERGFYLERERSDAFLSSPLHVCTYSASRMYPKFYVHLKTDCRGRCKMGKEDLG